MSLRFFVAIKMRLWYIENEVNDMDKISAVDKNFSVNTNIKIDGIEFYDVKKHPFEIYGVFFENGKFRRMDEQVAKSVSDGVHFLHSNTAGGRVRFKTDSSYVAIHVAMPNVCKSPNFAMAGCSGFDLYVRENGKDVYYKTYIPPFEIVDSYEGVVDFGGSSLREITINFPLYSDVAELYIGLDKNAKILSPTPYTRQKPIVYYGSSITQGGCASRPGMSYQSIISRRFDTDYINLGFSGNAKGETEMAEYIKNLDMSVFVYDYDHNAPDVDHLKKTHKPMFDMIRNANPNLPIIIVSRPERHNAHIAEMFGVIKETYDIAKQNGDKNVYLINGADLMLPAENEGTVDGIHPTDFGFSLMAKGIGDVIGEIFGR